MHLGEPLKVRRADFYESAHGLRAKRWYRLVVLNGRLGAWFHQAEIACIHVPWIGVSWNSTWNTIHLPPLGTQCALGAGRPKKLAPIPLSGSLI